MRVLRWAVAGLALGVLGGVAAGLFRRQPPAAYSAAYTSLTEDTAHNPRAAAEPV